MGIFSGRFREIEGNYRCRADHRFARTLAAYRTQRKHLAKESVASCTALGYVGEYALIVGFDLDFFLVKMMKDMPQFVRGHVFASGPVHGRCVVCVQGGHGWGACRR